MLHSQSRFCILFCFFLLLFDDGFSKPSSFLKSIRSLHRSEKGKTRLRRNLPSDEQSNDENSNSSEKNGKFWKENTLYEQFYVGPGRCFKTLIFKKKLQVANVVKIE